MLLNITLRLRGASGGENSIKEVVSCRWWDGCGTNTLGMRLCIQKMIINRVMSSGHRKALDISTAYTPAVEPWVSIC